MVAMVAGSSSEPSEVRAALLPADTSAPWEWRSFRASSDVTIEPGYLAAPQQVEFPTENRGEERTAHTEERDGAAPARFLARAHALGQRDWAVCTEPLSAAAAPQPIEVCVAAAS